MAHITYAPAGAMARQLVINGVDFSREVFRDVKLVEIGDDPETSEVGLQVTFAVSRLNLGDEVDVQVTDQFRSVAQRVRSIAEAVDR